MKEIKYNFIFTSQSFWYLDQRFNLQNQMMAPYNTTN